MRLNIKRLWNKGKRTGRSGRQGRADGRDRRRRGFETRRHAEHESRQTGTRTGVPALRPSWRRAGQLLLQLLPAMQRPQAVLVLPSNGGRYRKRAYGHERDAEKPDEYKEVLDAHRVDTAKYEQQAEQMRQETPDAAEKGRNPIPRARALKRNDSRRNRSRLPPRRDTSLSTTAVSTARRSPNAGVSTLRRWSSRAIWNGCATTASRALSTATLKSGVSALRCRHVCRCGSIPTVRYRSCLTRYAVRRITTNT